MNHPTKTPRYVDRLDEASTGEFKPGVDTARIKALGGDALCIAVKAPAKPRRTLDDMRKLSEEIKARRSAEKK